jgi:3-oxoacyl-[acyl-carrier protein] reductase
MLKGMVAATPLGRMGTADEIAAAACFLASDDGAFLTGQWISPNGGIFIG